MLGELENQHPEITREQKWGDWGTEPGSLCQRKKFQFSQTQTKLKS